MLLKDQCFRQASKLPVVVPSFVHVSLECSVTNTPAIHPGIHTHATLPMHMTIMLKLRSTFECYLLISSSHEVGIADIAGHELETTVQLGKEHNGTDGTQATKSEQYCDPPMLRC